MMLNDMELSFNNITDILHRRTNDFIYLTFVAEDGNEIAEINFYFGDSGRSPQFWKDCENVSELDRRKKAVEIDG